MRQERPLRQGMPLKASQLSGSLRFYPLSHRPHHVRLSGDAFAPAATSGLPSHDDPTSGFTGNNRRMRAWPSPHSRQLHMLKTTMTPYPVYGIMSLPSDAMTSPSPTPSNVTSLSLACQAQPGKKASHASPFHVAPPSWPRQARTPPTPRSSQASSDDYVVNTGEDQATLPTHSAPLDAANYLTPHPTTMESTTGRHSPLTMSAVDSDDHNSPPPSGKDNSNTEMVLAATRLTRDISHDLGRSMMDIKINGQFEY
ncbi:uncharacterized protein [Narcine bancroftii]|uniref:uncharacterized protein isoform X2 n=1 Tax=Narcine bancroftii TaxID=1343680 RepID=UPI003831C0E9